MPAFGGSLFALTDPFWMILVMESLGSGYRVWNQAGEVEFVAPGRGAVIAEFRVEDAVLDKRREAAADGSNVLRWFDTEIRSAAPWSSGGSGVSTASWSRGCASSFMCGSGKQPPRRPRQRRAACAGTP